MWWKIWLRAFRKNRLAVVGAIIVVSFLVAAVIGPYVAPYDPIKPNYRELLKAPSLQHPLGTDRLGRDVLSRVLHGSRLAAYIGFGVVAFEGIVGIALGIMAGYFGGVFDDIVMRLVDVMLSIPALVLAIVIAGTSGGGLLTIILTMVIVSWAHFARLMRGQALMESQRDYVEAARAIGGSHVHIILRHILPNTISLGIVFSTLEIPWALMFSAALSYLGIGVRPPAPEWGMIIANGRDFLDTAWWIATFPGLLLMLVVLGFNFMGDGLRDAFDPKQYVQRER
jgi:peptide/nickel transport system permease protein